MASASIIASKEFSDIVRSKRFIILLSVFVLLMVAAVASTYVSATQGITAPTAMPRGFLLLVASSLTSMMAYFAPILGIVLGVDAVSGEREKGTLKMVLAQPVFRDTFINGKFLGTIAAISLAVCVAFLVNVGGSIIVLGITPTGEDAARLLLFLIISIIYATAYYGIAILISTVSKRTTISVIASIMIWAIFTFILPIIATIIAFSIAPIRIQPGQNITITPELREELRRRTAVIETVSMFTPSYHFNRAANGVLRAFIGVGFTPGGQAAPGQSPQQATRAVSIIESLTMVWPNILIIALIAVFTLIATYMLFVRQETR
ncbi:MAG: ABC transporter permease subunit [Candidatus Bathyarchaeia archaeon]